MWRGAETGDRSAEVNRQHRLQQNQCTDIMSTIHPSGQSSMDIATVSSKGQLILPKSLRESVQLVPGSQLSVSFAEGEIRLRPLTPQRTVTLDEVAGCLARPGRKRLTDAQTQAAIRERIRQRNAA
jgi:AbrB family looped-hinge helix DNA binding protein